VGDQLHERLAILAGAVMQFTVEEPGEVIVVGQAVEHALGGGAPGRGGGFSFNPQGEAGAEDVVGEAVEGPGGDGGQQREAAGGSPDAGKVDLGFVEGTASSIAAVVETGGGCVGE
jgi:hypothetical protein